jgi:hypothetical protein
MKYINGGKTDYKIAQQIAAADVSERGYVKIPTRPVTAGSASGRGPPC